MLTVTPDEVEEAFVAANAGLSRSAIAVTCDNRRLQEVRVCLLKEFGFPRLRGDQPARLPPRQARDAAAAAPQGSAALARASVFEL